MSDNPFAASPVPGGQPMSTRPKAPGALTAILIISLILGILGLFGSCAGGAGLLMQSAINMENVQGAPEQMAFQKDMQDLQQQQKIPNMILIGLNLIVSTILTVGAIGCLSRKTFGHSLLTTGLLVAMGFVIFRTVMTIYLQYSSMGTLKKMMNGMMQNDPNMDQAAADMASNVAQGALIAGMVFAAVWALILLGYYIWAWSYMRKDQVKAYFGL